MPQWVFQNFQFMPDCHKLETMFHTLGIVFFFLKMVVMIYLRPLPLDLQAPQPGGVFFSLPFNLGINQYNARWGLKSTWGLGHSLFRLPLES